MLSFLIVPPVTARWHILVSGRVQGVGFRWFVREAAQSLGLGGWVRNLPGGEVEIEAQGEPESLSLLMERLRTGHPYARVDAVERREIARTSEEPGRGSSRQFGIR